MIAVKVGKNWIIIIRLTAQLSFESIPKGMTPWNDVKLWDDRTTLAFALDVKANVLIF